MKKTIFKKFKNKVKGAFSFSREDVKKKTTSILMGLLFTLRWIVIILAWTLYIILILSCFLIPYMILIVPVLYMIIKLIIKLNHFKFLRYVSANTIIHGGRRKGKGIMFQYMALKVGSCLSNIDWGYNSTVVNPRDFFESIAPNTTIDMINGTNVVVEKNEFFEGKPYLLDDVSVYFPNYNDNLLKKLYPSMSLLLPIQGHIYASWTCINVQNIERSYKILRELQMDGYFKALGTIGFGYIWSRLPIVRKYVRTKYRYHEKIDSAIQNILPFSKLGLVNRTSDKLYTTTASAVKEQYDGTNGMIFDSAIWLKKKHIKYDTRIYHEEIFGYKAPNQLKKKKTKKNKA